MANQYYQQPKVLQLLQLMRQRHPEQRQNLEKIQKAIKGKQSNNHNHNHNCNFNLSEDQLAQLLLQIKKKLKTLLKSLPPILKQLSKSTYGLTYIEILASQYQILNDFYGQYKRLITPIVHYSHNQHQHPYNLSHLSLTNLNHMRKNLLEALEKETIRRQQVEKKLDDYYGSVQRQLIKKEDTIKNLQSQFEQLSTRKQRKEGLFRKQTKSVGLQYEGDKFSFKKDFQKSASFQLESKNAQLMQYVALLQQKLNKRQLQNYQNKKVLQQLQNQLEKLSQEKRKLTNEYQKSTIYQNFDQRNSLVQRKSGQTQKQPQINQKTELQRVDKAISDKNSIFQFDNFNKSNESVYWNQNQNQVKRNLTNFDFMSILGTPQADRKTKSYFKSTGTTIKMDELWRFLYVQAQSIENMLENSQKMQCSYRN